MCCFHYYALLNSVLNFPQLIRRLTPFLFYYLLCSALFYSVLFSFIIFCCILFRDEIQTLCSLSDAMQVRTSRTFQDDSVIEGSRSYPVVTSLEQFWAGARTLRFNIAFTSLRY
jgi:hypothetical protein